jgi:cyclic pyranopterin phosphate synthase
VTVEFNHFDDEGRARMVDVSSKEATLREAQAEAFVYLGPDLLRKVLDRAVAKGDVFGVARLAGIAAVKRTADLIPLAHPLALHHAHVDFEHRTDEGLVRVLCSVKACEKTGVEMEAMTGAVVTALTVYDMCKGQDRSIAIGPVRLVFKTGGRSGEYRRESGKE